MKRKPSVRKLLFNKKNNKNIDLCLMPGVFEPTGTSSALIDAVLSVVSRPGKTLDLGCGSGIVGVSLHKAGIIDQPLYASDISNDAVLCAQKNAQLHNCDIITKCGSMYDPWENEKFDYIVDDVAGISENVAYISPWYNGIPCKTGRDGILLINEIIKNTPDHLNENGIFFFPTISFSNEKKILNTAKAHFSNIEMIAHKEWPMPKEMGKHIKILEQLKREGHISYQEKFGMILFHTNIYTAYNN